MKILKIILFIILFSGIAFVPFYITRSIPIKQIKCSNQYGKCSDSIVGSINNIEKTDIHNTKKNLEQLLNNNILVKNYSLQFQLPDTLNVNLIERKAKYALTIKEGKSAIIDKDGNVLTYKKDITIPEAIVSDDLPNIGTRLDNKYLFALEIVYDINTLYQHRVGKITNEGLVIEFKGGPNVLFPLEGEKDKLIGSLILIRSNLDNNIYQGASGSWRIETIDLRYDNPVIK